MIDAVVVGSGPNGLTAAASLALAGHRVHVVEAADAIGGACRTVEHDSPGWRHDLGATIHPLAAASPAYRALGVRDRGVEFVDPPVLLAHPLSDGGAALHRDLDTTASELGPDAGRYRRLVGPVVAGFDELCDDVLGPLVGWPRHPLTMARFGARAVLPAVAVQRVLRTEAARALVGGSAAHSYAPLHHPMTAGFAVLLHAAGHVHGWPVVRGGSGRLVDALAAVVTDAGGTIETGHRVGSRAALPPHRALLLDTTPANAVAILGDALAPSVARAYRRFRHGPGAFKIDYELSDPIPWRYEPARRAGTVHVIGDHRELAAAERAIHRGVMPERPFVLVAQASVVDPSRAPDGLHTGWVYAHVPHAYDGDARGGIERQLERFAPGFRDTVVAAHVSGPAALQRLDANLVGGDVGGGAYTGTQAVARPRWTRHPHRTGVPGVFLCSASAAPGGGAHGMAGHHAALEAARWLAGSDVA